MKLLNLQRLPRLFPEFAFIMRYTTQVPLCPMGSPPQETTQKKPKKK